MAVRCWCGPGYRLTELLDLFVVDGNLNADNYLIMLQEEIYPSLLYEDGNFPG